MPLLQVEHLTKSFGARRVLRDVTFSLAEGEVVGLVGTNGAGKSTLGDILAGGTAADGGTMTLLDHPYAPLSAHDARHLGVGVVEQLVRIDPGLTVAQAVFRGTAQAGRPQAELRRQAQVLLAEVALEVDPDTLVGELPHFVHGVVEIARVLAEDTRLVVLDEVSAALLPVEVEGLHAVTGRLSRQGRGVLYISHRLPEMLAVVDRVLVLRDGRIALDSPADALDPVRLAAETVGEPVVSPAPRRSPAAPAAPVVAVEAPVVSPAPRPAPAEEVVLEVRNLRVPGAVSGVDLLVRRGEVIGLTGHRGSGVGEIAEALSGELPAITDELLLHGEHRSLGSPDDDGTLRLPAYRPDEDAYGVDPGETIARTLTQERWGALTDLRKEIATLRGVIRTVHQMDVKTLSIRTMFGALSGGDQHKIALARWMATSARDVVVLHEPTRGLDVRARQQVRRMLDDATAQGTSVVVVSVDPDELAECCDRVGIVSDGRVARWIDTDGLSVDALRDRITEATATASAA
ncbi:ATP-binding cassette domain-containing protein [Modestobacter versicolor]|uniref:Ribose transport system ATP-binding protein n=1 Tax=Modestobacter versicolor TaxID=429133 RepID=A0A323VAV9_9ACTN|nr:ATP-binding cassette domain-containing protein [Modestobacter versicolor]MBB3675987.1 ribose transport system ATP-binding protein [Modestobacter versicolor]PZA21761.1 sugar ABC transporter ATP-binding protein [Modestobacter versicolor]